ncbi:hypothetical protein DOTSEDRAFT_176085 [Dothistroma septosporum NZE10]|uniref:Uncharacterized protein n=1 Tax=Dothistroma septosporum (strain NZE10 / CBS 128990) TaxID=675120 RepID=N1PK60_DOTSN|nr:hypothetical protein DOTSEDRAFT_176085 [Dothistroma septosporum NZE10]
MLRAVGVGGPGGFPMPELGTPESVRKQRDERVASIFKHFRLLHNILERYESTIQKRWLKKTKEQKRRILLASWGGAMPTTHRADFEAFKKLRDDGESTGHRLRSHFMWPFINQEDLTKPRTLLLFLNARGRNPPSDFAAADFEAMHIGVIKHAISATFLNEYVMLFNGKTAESEYGQLLSWDDHPDAFQWLHTRKHMQPGEGLLILESQEKTMNFLVECAKEILHDVDMNGIVEVPIQSAPPSVSELETGLASLALMKAEAAYRVPAHLDWNRIESLLAAKCDAAEDHLWSLREDPSYFSYVLRDAREHRQEMVKDARGQTHPAFRFNKEEILWAHVIGDQVTSAHMSLEQWTELHRRAVELKELESKHASRIKPEDDLPEEYLFAILSFRHVLMQFTQVPIGKLKVSLFASPPWRAYFVRQPHDDLRQTSDVFMSKPGVHFQDPERLMLWLLQTLWEDDTSVFLLRMTNLVDQLQHIIDSDPKAKDFVSSYIAAQIGDLSILCECLHQTDLYQPWANMFEDQLVDLQDKVDADFDKRRQSWTRLVNATKGSETLLARYGVPVDGRFEYPVEKRRTKENTETLRKAEQNLDAFWTKVDELLHRNAGELHNTATRQLMLQPRLLHRTPEWVEREPEQVRRIEAVCKPLSEIYFDLERRTESTTKEDVGIPKPRSKEKTRGTGAPEPSAMNHITSTEVDSSAHQSTFRVDARALKVFRTIFHTPSPNSNPGEIPWADFVHAMVSTGFRHEKLYGSVWQFNPTRLDVERGIQFHEPHPSPKIPYYMARRHGRRLNRAYGWGGGMFVLAEKVGR